MDEVTDRLWRGVKKGNTAEVSAALEQGASADARDDLRRTPLMEAAKRGRRSIISLLLAQGADINAQDKEGDTPLVHALLPDYTEVIALLLGNGANPAVANKKGDTAFKQLNQKQRILGVTTLVSLLLFIQGQRRPTKDKELQKIEIVEMGVKLYGVFVTYQKYGNMKQLLQNAEVGSRHDH